MTTVWLFCDPSSAGVTARLHMFDSHDLNVSQARVLFSHDARRASGAPTCGSGGDLVGVGSWRRGKWTRLKTPPGNCGKQAQMSALLSVFCYGDLLKWLKPGAKNKAADLWGGRGRHVCLSDHVLHEHTTAGQPLSEHKLLNLWGWNKCMLSLARTDPAKQQRQKSPSLMVVTELIEVSASALED